MGFTKECIHPIKCARIRFLTVQPLLEIFTGNYQRNNRKNVEFWTVILLFVYCLFCNSNVSMAAVNNKALTGRICNLGDICDPDWDRDSYVKTVHDTRISLDVLSNHITWIIEDFEKSEDYNIIVYTEQYENLANILQSAIETIQYSIDSYTDDLDRQIFSIFEATNLRKPLQFIILADVETYIAMLYQISRIDKLLNQQGYFTYSHRWLLLSNDYKNMDLMQPFLCEIQNVAVIVPIAENETHVYSAMFKDTGRMFELVGTIGEDGVKQGAMIKHKTVFPNANYGFNGRLIRVGSQLFSFYTMQDGDGRYHGIYVDLLEVMSQNMNFTYNITLGPHGLWGSLVNGSWNGIVGLVADDKVDISVAAMTTTPERATAMDFTPTPITQETISGLYRTPKPLKNTLLIFIKIFRADVWMVFLAILILYPIVLWGMSYVDDRIKGKRKRIHVLYDICACYWDIFACFMTQSLKIREASNTYSTLFICWRFFSLVFISVWSGNLISFIAVKLYPDMIPDIFAVDNQDKFTIGTQASTAILEVLPKSSNADLQDLWHKMQSDYNKDPETLHHDTDVLINKMLSEDFIFAIDAAASLRDVYNCSLSLIPGSIMPINYYIGMQKNSAYRELMNMFTMKAAEMGLHVSWIKKYVKDSGACYGEESGQVLEFIHFQSILIGLAVILGVSGLVLVGEVLWHEIPLGQTNKTSN